MVVVVAGTGTGIRAGSATRTRSSPGRCVSRAFDVALDGCASSALSFTLGTPWCAFTADPICAGCGATRGCIRAVDACLRRSFLAPFIGVGVASSSGC